MLIFMHVPTQSSFFIAATLSSSTCVGNAPNNVLLFEWLCQMHDTCDSHGIPSRKDMILVGSASIHHRAASHMHRHECIRGTRPMKSSSCHVEKPQSHSIHARILFVDQSVSNSGGLEIIHPRNYSG